MEVVWKRCAVSDPVVGFYDQKCIKHMICVGRSFFFFLISIHVLGKQFNSTCNKSTFSSKNDENKIFFFSKIV